MVQNAPAFIPPSMPSGSGNMPNAVNVPSSGEKSGEVSRSVAKSKVVRKKTSTVISTREEFVDYLRQNGLDLLTSWVEFQQNHDFINSSYVVYPQANNVIEPLIEFLQRYPQLKDSVEVVNQNIKNSLQS